jgi:hypothetical protein
VGGGSSANPKSASPPRHGSRFLHRCSCIDNSKRDLPLANLKHDVYTSSPSSKKSHMRVVAVNPNARCLLDVDTQMRLHTFIITNLANSLYITRITMCCKVLKSNRRQISPCFTILFAQATKVFYTCNKSAQWSHTGKVKKTQESMTSECKNPKPFTTPQLGK